MSQVSQEQQAFARSVRGEVRFAEPMKSHTTLQVGGAADIWFRPMDLDDVLAGLATAKQFALPWLVLGRGSNLLVRDGGFRGVVMSLASLETLQLEDPTTLYAEAGVRLKRLLGFCGEQGLTGLEGLEGVPGTVGGAVMMNAGTPAGVIGDRIINVQYIEQGEKMLTRTAKQLDFQYRKVKIPRTAIVIAARLSVVESTADAVKSRLAELRAKRETAQPGTKPSVGSVFRNPEGTNAWSLIDDAGLRGVRVGHARISELHANWIVNEGDATAKDVETLIRLMKERVKERSGIALEPEVHIVGEEL